MAQPLLNAAEGINFEDSGLISSDLEQADSLFEEEGLVTREITDDHFLLLRTIHRAEPIFPDVFLETPFFKDTFLKTLGVIEGTHFNIQADPIKGQFAYKCAIALVTGSMRSLFFTAFSDIHERAHILTRLGVALRRIQTDLKSVEDSQAYSALFRKIHFAHLLFGTEHFEELIAYKDQLSADEGRRNRWLSYYWNGLYELSLRSSNIYVCQRMAHMILVFGYAPQGVTNNQERLEYAHRLLWVSSPPHLQENQENDGEEGIPQIKNLTAGSSQARREKNYLMRLLEQEIEAIQEEDIAVEIPPIPHEVEDDFSESQEGQKRVFEEFLEGGNVTSNNEINPNFHIVEDDGEEEGDPSFIPDFEESEADHRDKRTRVFNPVTDIDRDILVQLVYTQRAGHINNEACDVGAVINQYRSILPESACSDEELLSAVEGILRLY